MEKVDARLDLLRKIPQVDALLSLDSFRMLAEEIGSLDCGNLLREVLDDKRKAILSGNLREEEELSEKALMDAVKEARQRMLRTRIQPLLNASGIVLHTNLGRAPLSVEISQKVAEISSQYSNLEYRLESGRRGSRYDSLEALLCELTGAEDALVVNNNAGAVLLVLAEIAKGKEVIVSRGELVEIGGAFRVPEVMEQSGAILKEIGTTNKVRAADYSRALTEETGALLKVHRSNFVIRGFTEEASLEELAAIAHEHGLPLIHDLGSGLMHPEPPAILGDEPTVRQSMEAGCDILCFSGDKLLGGPQAGIIVGRREYIQRIKKHPLTRALRCDKMTLFALQEILLIYREPERVNQEIPLYRMLTEPMEKTEEKADLLCDLLRQADVEAELIHIDGQVGGGSAPDVPLPSAGISLDPVSNGFDLLAMETQLRKGENPVIAYVQKDKLVFDLRTIPEEELERLARAILAALGELRERI